MEIPRRCLLQTMSTLPIVTLTGCSAISNNSPSPTQTPTYEQLTQTPVYTSDDVGLRIPDRIPTVEAPTNADLIVLHGNPAVDAEQAVTWLADERAVALLGDRAQSTWTTWTQSESYRTTFETRGRGEADPAPHLLVAAAVETHATTYRYSWGDQPSNDEILDALNEAMGEIATWTPQ